MRFKISLQERKNSIKLVTCVAWSSTDEIYSCGEDHQLICWHLESGMLNSSVVAEFPLDFYPTDMQYYPRPSQTTISSSKKQSLDVLLITTTDGKFYLISKSGRIEKNVSAHVGATLVGRWSYDGSAFFTAGEDGLIKIWSRSGMLRSTLVRGTLPIMTAAWSPNSSVILYSQGTNVILQSLSSNSKPQKWMAHEGLILSLSWNQCNDLIVTGGEDCRYKVWDTIGNQLYNSGVNEHPITSVNWCNSGNYFSIGSFNTVKLCDKTGWSHSLEKLNIGSVFSIAWSSDGTQVAMACGRGTVLTAHIIDRKLEWNNFEATLIRRKAIEIKEIGTECREVLEIADRVVLLEFGFDHLVVITPSQCHIYSTLNWNTPAIFDLRSGSVSTVLLAEKHFLLVEWNLITLYNYQGRSLGTPKWKGISQELLHPSSISLCSDTLVVRDQSSEKLLHVLDISYAKPISELQSYVHLENVKQLALNHVGGINNRQLSVIDINRDLFLVSIRSTGFGRVCKIAVMAQSIVWACDADVLVAMLDATLSVWLCPNCVHYSDRKAIKKTRIDKENSEYGKQPSIVRVQNGMVTVRRGDGALVVSSFYTFFTNLHRHILQNRWSEGLSLCRIAQNEILWTCMAVMAIDSKELTVAEEACAAIGRFDKVELIQYIKGLTKKSELLAEMALLAGDLLAAEGILLQNGLVNEAIRINIQIYNWNRALELGLKYKKQLTEILSARQNYLQLLDKQETNQSFLALLSNMSKTNTKENFSRLRELDEIEKSQNSESNDRLISSP